MSLSLQDQLTNLQRLPRWHRNSKMVYCTAVYVLKTVLKIFLNQLFLLDAQWLFKIAKILPFISFPPSLSFYIFLFSLYVLTTEAFRLSSRHTSGISTSRRFTFFFKGAWTDRESNWTMLLLVDDSSLTFADRHSPFNCKDIKIRFLLNHNKLNL
jgi:hypothetical protein